MHYKCIMVKLAVTYTFLFEHTLRQNAADGGLWIKQL